MPTAGVRIDESVMSARLCVVKGRQASKEQLVAYHRLPSFSSPLDLLHRWNQARGRHARFFALPGEPTDWPRQGMTDACKRVLEAWDCVRQLVESTHLTRCASVRTQSRFCLVFLWKFALLVLVGVRTVMTWPRCILTARYEPPLRPSGFFRSNCWRAARFHSSCSGGVGGTSGGVPTLRRRGYFSGCFVECRRVYADETYGTMDSEGCARPITMRTRSGLDHRPTRICQVYNCTAA